MRRLQQVRATHEQKLCKMIQFAMTVQHHSCVRVIDELTSLHAGTPEQHTVPACMSSTMHAGPD
jgi:hypothetical protein